MKTMLKRILTTVVAVSIMLLTPGIVADAANACIYYERIVGAAGEKICIPVGIKNNPGIMGFRITVKYPQELSSPTVEGNPCRVYIYLQCGLPIQNPNAFLF